MLSETERYEYYSSIADSVKNIQTQATSLKDVEDKEKVLLTLTRIQDSITEIRQKYNDLEIAEFQAYSEEPKEDIQFTGTAFFTGM